MDPFERTSSTTAHLLHPSLVPLRVHRNVVDLLPRESPLEEVEEQMLNREDDEHDQTPEGSGVEESTKRRENEDGGKSVRVRRSKAKGGDERRGKKRAHVGAHLTILSNVPLCSGPSTIPR